jgi:DNA-binding NarL/FixJ family response regulator
MNKLRILVADDHEIVRHGLVALVKSHPGWEICAEADNGRQAVELARDLKPDVAILDIGMPTLNGLEATRLILRDNPRVKVLILTINDADQAVRAVLDAGARGFLLKSDAARELVAAVEALQHNKTFFTARVAEMVLSGYLDRAHTSSKPTPTLPSLTPRERQVVQLLAEGKSTKEVAVHLDLSVKTAETHRSNIMRKLKLHSVSELVLYAVRNNIIQVAIGAPAFSVQAPSQPHVENLSPRTID